MSLLYAATDVDPVWMFVLAVIAFVCGIVLVVQTLKAVNLAGVGLTAIGLAGMLAWWP